MGRNSPKTADADQPRQPNSESKIREPASDGGDTTFSRRAGLKAASIVSLGLLTGASGQAAGSVNGQSNSSNARPWNQDVDAQNHSLLNLSELTMSDNSTGISNFEGDNLQIDENGILNASSKVTFHHIDDYGADPTGEDPSDAAVNAAIEAAEPGDWIALTNGTYYLAERHHIYKELILYGAGGTIESDVHPETGYFDGPVDGTQDQSIYSIFSFYGDKGEPVSLTESVGEGSDQVPVESTEPFEVGGGVLVNNAAEDTADRPYYPTVTTVREIEDGVLYLDIPCRYDYNVDGPHAVYPLNYLDDAGFVECHFRNRHEFYWDDELRKVMGGFRDPMYHQHCRRPLVVNCTVSGYDTKAWTGADVSEALIINLRAERPMNVNGQHAETIYISGSTNVHIYNPVIRKTRRAIDIAGGQRAVSDVSGRGGCKDVNVYNPDITGVTLTALSYHNSSNLHVAGNMNVYGGRIDCKPTDPTQDDHGGEPDRRWEYERSAGFADTSDNGRLHVKETTFVTRDYAGLIYGTGTIIEGCEFTTVPSGGGTDTPVLRILNSAEDITIRDTIIYENRNGSDNANAVYINDAQNVDLDVNIRGNFAENPIRIEGGRHLRLRAQLSDGDAESSGLSIGGTVDDLSITGSGQDGGYGVIFRKDTDATNVTVRDFAHYGTQPVVSIEEGASLENLRLSGLTASGEENHVDLGETLVDGLWVKDSIFDELRGLHPDQEDAEHTFLAGNRTGWESDT